MKEKIRDVFHKLGLDIRRWDDMSVFSKQLVHILHYLDINLVLDVGAHWGEYAETIRRCGYTGHITSFEPLSSAWEILRHKACKPDWHAAKVACGTAMQEKLINVAGGNASSSSLLKMTQAHIDVAPHTATIRSEMINVQRLDKLYDWKGERNTFLKIDTQGYELEVLKGSTGIIDRIKGVQVEMSTAMLYEGQALDFEVSNWLQSYGFVLWALNPFLYDPKSGKLLQYDAIFVRE